MDSSTIFLIHLDSYSFLPTFSFYFLRDRYPFYCKNSDKIIATPGPRMIMPQSKEDLPEVSRNNVMLVSLPKTRFWNLHLSIKSSIHFFKENSYWLGLESWCLTIECHVTVLIVRAPHPKIWVRQPARSLSVAGYIVKPNILDSHKIRCCCWTKYIWPSL